MEIERKYLVGRLPENLDNYEHREIEQYYLCVSPTLRVRRLGDTYIMTVKEHLDVSSGAIHNREEEFVLTKESYEHLRAKSDSRGISKTRYRINLRRSELDGSYEGLIAELDVFHGNHEGLLLVEVEFPNTEAADNFVPPEWFGEEVSGDPRYRNSYLAGI